MWSSGFPGSTLGLWPAVAVQTGLSTDWLIYQDVGPPLVPTSLELFLDGVQINHDPIVPPNFPTFLELVNPNSTAADELGRFLVTAGKFPVTQVGL